MTHNAETFDLLPCPFCGGDADLKTYSGWSGLECVVECIECGVSQIPNRTCNKGSGSTKAISRWNTRAALRALSEGKA